MNSFWGGAKNFLNIGVIDDILVTIPKGMTDKLTVTIDADKHLQAPIKKETVVGSITVKLNNKVIKVEKLVALESVNQGGWFKRTLDKSKRLFLNFFE